MSFKKMKSLALGVLLCGVAASSYADNGFYLGLTAGETFTHQKPVSLQTCTDPRNCPPAAIGPIIPPLGPSETVHPDSSGIGGRLFAGYNLTPIWAIEMGYTHYAASTVNISSSPALAIGNPTGKPAVNTNAFDMVGRGTWRTPFGLGIFGKLGFSIVRVSQAGTYTTTYDQNSGNTTVRADGVVVPGSYVQATSLNTYFRPTAGVGVSYDLNQNWIVDLSESHVFGGGGVQSLDLVGLGITYRFADQYCGQFLC